jgi:GT2 family glycosyltransferase
MKLAVGFITYNETSAKYLADFLPSLRTALGFLSLDDYQIYVWDNSPADSRLNHDALENFNKQTALIDGPLIKYFTTGVNLGYGCAYNRLINEAVADCAEYFLIINPDTILEPETISELIKALDDNHNLGSVSPKIKRWDFANRTKTNIIDSVGLILKPGLRFFDLGAGEEDRNQFNQATIIGPSGAAGLFRFSALTDIAAKQRPDQKPQYFDEQFFMYKEDCDLAYRLFLAGYASRLVDTALVYHDRTAASSGTGMGKIISDRRAKDKQIRAWSFRNQHLIFVKHWKKQNFVSRLLIISYSLAFLIFSLILEQFLLKEYYYILRYRSVLTNTK